MDYSTQLANMWKNRENKKIIGVTIGKVIEAPPNLRISIWNKQVILEPTQLYMNDRLFGDHTRTFEIEGDITEQSMTVDSSLMTKAGSGPHLHDLKSWEGTGSYKSNGTIVNTDTLKVGDLVKLTPTEDFQVWFVDHKVRKVK